MSKNLRDYTRAVYTMDAVVNRMPADAWDNPSPCDGWTARQVLGHFMWGAERIASAAAGEDPPAPRSEAEMATDDPPRAWAATRDHVLGALDHDGALRRDFSGPFGPGDVDSFLPIHGVDGLLHAWDVATAGGIEAHLPTDLAAAGAAAIASFGDGIRQPGVFGPAVAVSDDADDVTRFVAIAGRTP
ncbi:MAG: TIGR03086 family metal-binding protein [Desertimonas sp.]